MATTTNYSWTTPDDTSLVKDGASAIRALGTAIDTSMNTALVTKKAGMVLLSTTSFSGVASHSLSGGTFNSTYDCYKIIYNNLNISTSAQIVSIRLRDSVVGNLTTSTYHYGGTSTTTTATTVAALSSNSAGDQEIVIGSLALTNKHSIEIELYNPFNSALKSFFIRSTQDGLGNQISAYNTTASAYDSLVIYPAANNITGSVSVYGYNK